MIELFILASQSPRRKELLARILPEFKVVPAKINEEIKKEDQPIEYVERMALEKAQHVAEKYPNDIIIGCDTIVTFDNKILGKPSSRKEAFDMLHSLSGREHCVYTSVFVKNKTQQLLSTVPATVSFYELSDQEINDYLDGSDYLDKAGAYGIQEQGALFVKLIQGDYYSIMGLPIATLYRMFREI